MVLGRWQDSYGCFLRKALDGQPGYAVSYTGEIQRIWNTVSIFCLSKKYLPWTHICAYLICKLSRCFRSWDVKGSHRSCSYFTVLRCKLKCSSIENAVACVIHQPCTAGKHSTCNWRLLLVHTVSTAFLGTLNTEQLPFLYCLADVPISVSPIWDGGYHYSIGKKKIYYPLEYSKYILRYMSFYLLVFMLKGLRSLSCNLANLDYPVPNWLTLARRNQFTVCC